jgi:CDP-glucose 4,6-dehydratase
MVTSSAPRTSAKSAIVTGAAGFKGRWLMDLLDREGIRPIGWDIRPPADPGEYEWRQIDLAEPFELPQVDFVFHLAAQALVPVGYENPRGTWRDNVTATVNVLEALRLSTTPVTAVVVTSDKVYRLPPEPRPLREDDELGGYCPYSTSKAACELAVQSYRSLMPAHVRIATVRAGNVVGGADPSPNRLVPDIIAAARRGEAVELRNPASTRPWLFVMDCLWGYWSMAKALERGDEPGPTMNFGPLLGGAWTAGEIATFMSARLDMQPPVLGTPPAFHEAPYLQLSTERAAERLGWRPLLSTEEALEWTAEWAVAWLADEASAAKVVTAQVDRYLGLVRNR